METIELTLTDIAHGGFSIGRDTKKRVIFVPGGIPGERVKVKLTQKKGKVQHSILQKVLKPAKSRIPVSHPVLGPHGGLTYQHIDYPEQLRLKRQVVQDQLKRVGKIKAPVLPVEASPQTWGYERDVVLSPTADGGLGFWSPAEHKVMPVKETPTLVPALQQLIANFDVELPDLRKLNLRTGSDDESLIAFEINEVEPPEIAVDIPVSASIVFPDRTAANLIGQNHIVRQIKEVLFKVPAGVRFLSNLSIGPILVDKVIGLVEPAGRPVIELYTGVGLFTTFLAPHTSTLIGLDPNQDAINAAAENLNAIDPAADLSLYLGWPEEVLPQVQLAERPVVLLNDPPRGVKEENIALLAALNPAHIVYFSSDIATLARDGQRLKKAGYRCEVVQPFDIYPQTFHIHAAAKFVPYA